MQKGRPLRVASGILGTEMQAKTKTIEGSLATVSGKRRAALKKLQKTIRSLVPDAEDRISYRIPAFRLGGRVVAGFCARTDGCSFFPFSGKTLRTLAKETDAVVADRQAKAQRASTTTSLQSFNDEGYGDGVRGASGMWLSFPSSPPRGRR
jgi:uncharacterized protein YdhG (YjbR/CyaY superfamily)